MLDEADEINNSHNSIERNEEEKLSNDSLGQTPEYLKNKHKQLIKTDQPESRKTTLT